MKINKENYEAYFIDYLEGNLDELMVNDFIEFLQNNPELKNELSLFEPVSLKPEEITFKKKESLLKEKLDSEKEFNKAAVANIEGDMSEEEKQEFNNYLLTHPEKRKESDLFAQTILHPDQSIVFKNKKKLYHLTIGRTILFWTGRVAAIFILAFSFYLFIDRQADEVVPVDNVVKMEDKKVKTVNPVELKKVQEEDKKKESEKVNKNITKPPVKKVAPKTKPKKSLRESTQGRMTHEKLVMNRVPVEVPAELEPLTASLNVSPPVSTTLATMNTLQPLNQEQYTDERLLADIVKEKTGINRFSFNKITKAGLNIMSSITKDNFSYETNDEGKITEYKYDSRLLAFSIPSQKSNPQK